MERNTVNQYNFNYRQILIDEVALEGLEGIGTKLLWSRLSHRITNVVTDKMKGRFWDFLVSCDSVEIYQTPEPAINYDIVDRFTLVDEGTGYLENPDFYMDGPYEYNPIEGEYGSCVHYHSRKLIPKKDLACVSYEEVLKKYGDNLVIVASLEERWHALSPHLSTRVLEQLTPIHYAMLELIGRGRENGQMTLGCTKLLKIVKDHKVLFYYRKKLVQLNLISVIDMIQHIKGKGSRSMLIRLKRFHTPKVLTIPKHGKLHILIKHLLDKPDHKDERLNLISSKILNAKMWKKMHKKVNLFKFSSTTNEPYRSNEISLVTDSEESPASDEEGVEQPVKCQYKIGETLHRQAYDRLLEAGSRGLSQVQLAQTLGVSFYTSRALCRVFKSKHLVREFLEDKGRNRSSRYVAIELTGNTGEKYDAAKEKFLKYLAENDAAGAEEKKPADITPINESEHLDSDDEIPLKKIKLENETNDTLTKNITECRFNRSIRLFHTTKGPSLRQLQIANAIIEIVREKHIIEGIQTLHGLLSNSIEPPIIDSHSMRRYLAHLQENGQIGVFKINWPKFKDKNTILICAPHIKMNGPEILAIFTKICNETARKHKEYAEKAKKKELSKSHKTLQVYARFMKAQKLHEYLFNLIYINENNVKLHEGDLPKGCSCIGVVLSEMPLKLAMGHISIKKTYEIDYDKVRRMNLTSKLRDASQIICDATIYCPNFCLSLKNSFETLIHLGLVQTCFATVELNKKLIGQTEHIFYLNRHAKITDTRGTWPRSESSLEKLERTYSFNDSDDVHAFWAAVYDICTNTVVKLDKRIITFPAIPIRSIDEVSSYDNGTPLGDGLGAGGYHSAYYFELPRLWRIHNILPFIKVKRKPQEIKKDIKTTTKKNLKKRRKKKPLAIKKIQIKKTEKEKDAAADALKKRNRFPSVTWTKWDDNVVFLTKVAMGVMSPTTQPGSVRVTNSVIRDLVTLRDSKKNIFHCFRRMKELESKSSFVFEKQQLLTELRRNAAIDQYVGLHKKLRMKYASNRTRYLNEARYRCMELIWLIEQLSKNIAYNDPVPSVATSIEEFVEKFHIDVSGQRKPISLYASLPECSVELATLKESVMLAVNVGQVGELTAAMSTSILDTFKHYPESILRTATDQLHKSGAVAVRDKQVNLQFQRSSFSDIAQYSAGYRLSSIHQRRLCSRLNSSFIEDLTEMLEIFPKSDAKVSAELCCFLCELQVLGKISITASMPLVAVDHKDGASMSDMEITSKFKSGQISWSNKSNLSRMEELYNNTDYKSAMLALIR